MMRKSMMVAMLGLAGAVATQASAQAPGWRPNLNPIQATNLIARCIARAQPVDAIGVLDLPVASVDQDVAAAGLIGKAGSCDSPDRGVEFTTIFLVGGMAEELLLTKYAEVSPDVIKLIQPTVQPRSEEEDLALCFSEKWPAETRDIIATSVGSPGEALAVGKILPNIGTCVPAGMKMRLSPATIRALAAVALYRVSSQVEAGLLKIGAQ